MTNEEPSDRPQWDLSVLAFALEAMERDLEATTDASEHRELTEQIRIITARIDRLIGAAPSAS